MKISKLFEKQIPSRIKKLKKDLIERDARMCVNRALLITESYKKHEAQSILLKRAFSLKKILSEIPIFIQDNSLLVGNPASALRGAEIFPEMSVHWMKREL